MIKLIPKISLILSIIFSFLLFNGCSSDSPLSHWDGEWKRRVQVPSGMPGRCYDEKLHIQGRQWVLIATIHSTFECNQPFLELGFAADIEEVLIKKDSKENNVTLKLSDIHLTSMIDVATKKPERLSEDGVIAISDKYVPFKWQQADQNLLFNLKRNAMSAPLFLPVASVAIPDLIKKKPMIRFRR